MRIIRVEHGGTAYYGVLEDGLVFRLHKQPGHMEPIPLSEAKVLPLVTPSKVICVGLNYKAHAEELGYPLPNMPSFFLKPPSSIIGNGEPIILPSGTMTLPVMGLTTSPTAKRPIRRSRKLSIFSLPSWISETHRPSVVPQSISRTMTS